MRIQNLFDTITMNFTGLFKKKIKLYEPWLSYYSDIENTIEWTDKTIYEYMMESSSKYSSFTALNYFENKISYKEMYRNIDLVASALRAHGVKEGDIVTICLPNMPEAIYSFYACNKIGAVADMIHPLSSPAQLKFYLSESKSRILILLSDNYIKYRDVIEKSSMIFKTILVSPSVSMNPTLKTVYNLTKGFFVKKPSIMDEDYMVWKDFLVKGFGYTKKYVTNMKYDDVAVILHSGGTTGTSKGIMLTNFNFNAEAQQDGVIVYNVRPRDKIVTILPNFHGFGLCVCIHTPLCLGVETILMPRYDEKMFTKIWKNEKPHVMLGVPTLFEAMINNPAFDKVDLSQVKYIISGGDNLSPLLEKKFNDFLHKHGASIDLCKGYGMTEAVAAVTYTFPTTNKESSIGIPIIGNNIKIVDVNSKKELEFGEVGEIIVTGPTVMKGYLNNPVETDEVIEIRDGMRWLHTGDLGYISPDGLLYFTQRLKRMIVSSGFNVYPAEIEKVVLSHPNVLKCCCIGVPHPYKMQVAKVFIVLKENTNAIVKAKIIREIKERCKKELAMYSQPKYYEFRKELPLTNMNKIDYKKLEEEEMQKD